MVDGGEMMSSGASYRGRRVVQTGGRLPPIGPGCAARVMTEGMMDSISRGTSAATVH